MKWMLGVAIFSALLGVRSADIDPKEPISLDLKDAKLVDVIQTLGAMANLPVSIAEGIGGTVTVQLHDVPFQKALEQIGVDAGISLRVEGGRLVATVGGKAPSTAPLLPAVFRSLPRVPLSEYSWRASDLPPIFVRTRWNRESGICSRVEYGPPVAVPLGRGSEPLVLTHFAFEPVSKTRYVAVDGPARHVLSMTQGGRSTFDQRSEAGLLNIALSGEASGRCFEPEPAERLRAQVTFRIEVSQQGDEGDIVVMAPRMSLLAGGNFSGQSGQSGPRQERAFILHGYVSRAGDAVAVVLTATAHWTDPEDGREYVLAQTAASREFHPLRTSGVVAARLPKGAATEFPLEVRVFADDASLR